jgi:hypothetical protein
MFEWKVLGNRWMEFGVCGWEVGYGDETTSTYCFYCLMKISFHEASASRCKFVRR